MTVHDHALLASARAGDRRAFDRLVEPHRRELHAHAYRMLGSLHDAEDAVQETLLAAWRGLPGFEARSSLRTWLYSIATRACLRVVEGRKRRALPSDRHDAAHPLAPVGELVAGSEWIEPYPDELLRYERRESVELAFAAALQHLPGTQRAVLILCEVLGFSAQEAAGILDTTVASVNSALQRARRSVAERLPERTQQATLHGLGDARVRELVGRFMAAWQRADVEAIVAMLAEDAVFVMPPLPAWFAGRDDIGTFVAERVFATPWQFRPLRASGQPAMACYQRRPDSGRYLLSALNVLTFRGERVAAITSFLDPGVLDRFGLPPELPAPDR